METLPNLLAVYDSCPKELLAISSMDNHGLYCVQVYWCCNAQKGFKNTKNISS
jgi:hypothetical protein